MLTMASNQPSVGSFSSMSDVFFAPMYGDLSNSAIMRSGSVRFSMGSGFYGNYPQHQDPSSPFSGESMASPFYESQVSTDVEPTYFGFTATSPKNAATLVDLENFSFKRLRSLDSGLLESPDSSPILRGVSKSSKTSPTHIAVSRKTMPNPTAHKDETADQIPPLKLGDDGRSKLKSALSEQARMDSDIRAQIDAIGKIRLASIPQLMEMSRVCGLWDYALSLARDHEATKLYKRTG